MSTAPVIRRWRIRHLRRLIARSEERHAALRREAKVEAMYCQALAAHLVELEAEAENRGWARKALG